MLNHVKNRYKYKCYSDVHPVAGHTQRYLTSYLWQYHDTIQEITQTHKRFIKDIFRNV